MISINIMKLARFDYIVDYQTKVICVVAFFRDDVKDAIINKTPAITYFKSTNTFPFHELGIKFPTYLVNGNVLVSTGMEVKLMNGTEVKDTLSVVVSGDVNGDGQVDTLKEELTTSYGFRPIGFLGSYYLLNACFDGKNHEIKNLYINRNDTNRYVGLFGYIINSEVRNLSISGNITYNSAGAYAGGIAGYTTGKCIFKNCDNHINATISGGSIYYGGIVGYSASSIDIINCSTYDQRAYR